MPASADYYISVLLPLWVGVSSTTLTEAWGTEQKTALHIVLKIFGEKSGILNFHVVQHTFDQSSLLAHHFYEVLI